MTLSAILEKVQGHLDKALNACLPCNSRRGRSRACRACAQVLLAKANLALVSVTPHMSIGGVVSPKKKGKKALSRLQEDMDRAWEESSKPGYVHGDWAIWEENVFQVLDRWDNPSAHAEELWKRMKRKRKAFFARE